MNNSEEERSLLNVLSAFMKVPFSRYDELRRTREELLLSEIDQSVSPHYGHAIRAFPIQVLAENGENVIEVAVSMFRDEYEYKTYIYVGEDGRVTSDGNVRRVRVEHS